MNEISRVPSGADLKDVIQLRGSLEIVRKNAYNGQVVETRKVDNVVVTVGRRWVLEAIQSGNAASAQVISNMAIGTSTSAPATSETALVNESTRKSIGTFTTTNLTSNPPSWRAEVTYATNEGNTTLGEVGLFNSSSGGTMLSRATFSTIDKATSNTLTISYTISN